MNCRQINRMLSARQDGELSADRERQVESHLRDCAACRAAWQDLQQVLQRLRLARPPAADPFFPGRVMAGLRERPAAKARLLRAAAYAAIFIMIFLSGFFLQTTANGQADRERLPAATFSAVLLEPQALGLLAVHDDTLSLFERERP